MTISSQLRTAGPFTGNGVAMGGTFSFKIFSATEMTVVETNTSGVDRTLTYGTDFSVTLNSDQNASPGGTINYLIAGTPSLIPTGYILNATSNVAYLQPVALTNQGGFFPKVINDAFDRLTILVQQLIRGVNASLKFPLSDGIGIASELPNKAARLGKVLGFDATTGSPVVSTQTLAQLEAGSTSATASAAAAAASASAASASATAAAASISALSGTSTTSTTIGTGTKVFTTQSGKQFNNAQVLVSSAADPTDYMHGPATYVGDQLTVNVIDTGGSGTAADWNITVSGTQGPIGATGPSGPGSGDMTAANYLSELNANKSLARTNILAAASGFNNDITRLGALTTYLAMPQDFRLSLTTAVPVTTSDVTGAGTLYAVPYVGNTIALWDGSKWITRNSAEFSIALSGLTSGRPYDVFCYDNAGIPTLEVLAWASDTARATALAYQNGVLVKSGAVSRRYLGTFYATSTTTTEDSKANRYLWNYYHRRDRLMQRFETTASWNYTTPTVRQANGNTANQLNFVIGVVEDTVFAKVNSRVACSAVGVTIESPIGLNSITAGAPGSNFNVTSSLAGGYMNTASSLEALPALGKNYLSWLEYSIASGTTTWEGQSIYGIQGRVKS